MSKEQKDSLLPIQTQISLPLTHLHQPQSQSQLTWLKQHGILENVLLPTQQHQEHKQKRLLKELEEKNWYQSYHPSHTQINEGFPFQHEPSPPSTEQTISQELHELNHLFAKSLKEESRQRPDTQTKIKKNLFIFPSLLGSVGLVVTFFMSVTLGSLIVFSSAILFLKVRHPKSSQQKRLPIQGRVVQIKHRLEATLSLLDESQMVTAKQQQVFLGWAKNQVQTKIKALNQDPTTPIDDLRFKEELFSIIMTNVQKGLEAHTQSIQRRKKEQQQADELKEWERQVIKHREEQKQTRLREQAELAQRQIEQKQRQQFQEEKTKRQTEEQAKQKVKTFNKEVAGQLAKAQDNITAVKELLAQSPLLQTTTPFESIDQTITIALQNLRELRQSIEHEWVEADYQKQFEEAQEAISVAQTKRDQLKEAYKQYEEEFERIEAESKRINDYPKWLLKTMMHNQGSDQRELKRLAFDWYLKEGPPSILAQTLSLPR